jgi:hypothetical protein
MIKPEADVVLQLSKELRWIESKIVQSVRDGVELDHSEH